MARKERLTTPNPFAATQASAVSGAHVIHALGQAEPQRSAAPMSERDRMRQALADAQREAREARRELEEVRRERDALKLELASALEQLAEDEQVLDVDGTELLIDDSPHEASLDRPALPPPLVQPPPLAMPLVTPPPSLVPAAEPAPFISLMPGAEPAPFISVMPAPELSQPFVSLMPGAEDGPVSLSRMVVSTRPPAEMETDVERPSDIEPGERPSSIERRRRARLGCEFEVEFLGDSHLIAGLTQDISEGGVFVATYQALPLGTVVSLGLELPSGRVVVQGAVRWRRDGVEDSELRPGLGIQFIDLHPQTVAVLTEFCRAHPAHYYEM
jgi:uncharacterized protein (TIGR02266 family)